MDHFDPTATNTYFLLVIPGGEIPGYPHELTQAGFLGKGRFSRGGGCAGRGAGVLAPPSGGARHTLLFPPSPLIPIPGPLSPRHFSSAPVKQPVERSESHGG